MQFLPDISEPHAIAVRLLTWLASYLFSRDKITIETAALILLVVLSVDFRVMSYGAAHKGATSCIVTLLIAGNLLAMARTFRHKT